MFLIILTLPSPVLVLCEILLAVLVCLTAASMGWIPAWLFQPFPWQSRISTERAERGRTGQDLLFQMEFSSPCCPCESILLQERCGRRGYSTNFPKKTNQQSHKL